MCCVACSLLLYNMGVILICRSLPMPPTPGYSCDMHAGGRRLRLIVHACHFREIGSDFCPPVKEDYGYCHRAVGASCSPSRRGHGTQRLHNDFTLLESGFTQREGSAAGRFPGTAAPRIRHRGIQKGTHSSTAAPASSRKGLPRLREKEKESAM